MARSNASHRVVAWRKPLLLILAAATAVVAPMLFLGNASGHDFLFHVPAWLDVNRQWREGILYPRWAEWANWGFGEPRFIFYPPASWILGAALGFILPWAAVPAAIIWMSIVLAGMCAWRLAREWLSPVQAAAAAVFFAVNPYHLAISYYRSDFAELLASALFPLLVLGVFRLIRGMSDGPWIIVFALAAIWLSNSPAAVIVTYSICLLLGIGCALRQSLKPLAIGFASISAGMALAAFYIFPAAWEQRWVQIDQALSPGLQPWQNFIFTHSNNPEFLLFNWKVSCLALFVMLVTGISAVFVARQRHKFPEQWWSLSALAAAAALLMFKPSRFLWTYLPKLRFVQFPWRWAGPLGLVFALFLAWAPVSKRQRAICWILAIVAIVALGTSIANDAWWDTEDVPNLIAAIHSGQGYEGTDEYQPTGANRYRLPHGDDAIPRVTFPLDHTVDPSHSVFIEKWTGERKTFQVNLPRETTIALRLLCYPAWAVSVDNTMARTTCDDETGRMLIRVPQGTHRVAIRFRRTWDRTLGIAISMISWTALLLFAFVRTRTDIRAKARVLFRAFA